MNQQPPRGKLDLRHQEKGHIADWLGIFYWSWAESKQLPHSIGNWNLSNKRALENTKYLLFSRS